MSKAPFWGAEYVSVQSLNRIQLFTIPYNHFTILKSLTTPCNSLQRTVAQQASLSFTISWGLLKFKSVDSVMPSNHLILCHPFLL